MTLKLYLDFMSQPSRALYIFFKLNKIPFEPCQVALRNGEHLSEEFKTNLNRFQKVPFIHDDQFRLAESVAIVRYVTKKFNLDNHWYPTESRAQARVDEYLEWQHNNTRVTCALYFQQKWLIPLMTGKPPDAAKVQKLEDNMVACFKTIENVWLDGSPYLAGQQISVADIWAACEIEQPRIVGYDPCKDNKILGAWLERVRSECGPVYQEAHKILNKMAEKAKL